jgi:starch-binding outer membrane protein, SusD/RagB family
MRPIFSRRRRAVVLIAPLALLVGFGACKESTVPNFNNPNIEGLLNAPNAATVNTTVIGLLVGLRANVGTWATGLGILGREVYNLDPAEPRNVLGYLVGPLEPGGFVADVGWSTTYRNLRTAATVLDALDKVPDYTATQKSAVRGFVKTIIAQEYVNQLRVRDTFGIVVDVPSDPTVLGAFVTKDSGFKRAAALFDEAKTDLNAGGATFPFALTSGFAGFNTPATFLKVNRALKARGDVYRGAWAEALVALSESFISTASGSAAALATGPYHVYSSSSGDAFNPLFDAAPRALVAVPSFLTDAQKRVDGSVDLRASSKALVTTVTVTTQSVSSNVKIIAYASNVAPVPIIKNEELILLRAEANNALNNRAAAIQDIDFVRVNSGGLAPLGPAYAGDLVDEILYNRRYSLFDEYGHRWVDLRRYGRLGTLEKALPTHKIFPVVPIPVDECNQRLTQTPKGCVNVAGF